jgi:hypothetical protein
MPKLELNLGIKSDFQAKKIAVYRSKMTVYLSKITVYRRFSVFMKFFIFSI